jgi:hypothetical protein
VVTVMVMVLPTAIAIGKKNKTSLFMVLKTSVEKIKK